MVAEFKCMYCGRWHKDGSTILNRHIHQYYYKYNGTVDLNRWERRESGAKQLGR
jgi:hypothetical protein